MTSRLLLFSLVFGSGAAFADTAGVTKPTPCIYSGQINLSADEQIYCDGDILVEPGTDIVTNDNFLQFITPGNIEWGTPENGVTVSCADKNGVATGDSYCGNVQVDAGLTMYGSLSVNTASAGREAGRIDVTANSYNEFYRQKLVSGKGGGMMVQRNGKDETKHDASFRQGE